MKNTLFKGVATALYTPITDDKIDFSALGSLIEEQIKSGISAIILLGTTGESPTIDDEERKQIIKFAVKNYKSKIPIIIGCGSNCTKRARLLTKQAKDLGADGGLSVTPYYNKCPQRGAIKHYEEISKEGLPFIVYNVPSRTGMNLSPETVLQLSYLPFFAGIKEASTVKLQINSLFKTLNQNADVYCGNDCLNGYFSLRKASGYISTLSNIIPLKIVDYFNNFKNFYKNGKEDVLRGFYECLKREINPIAIKAIARIYGKKGTELRLPLVEASKQNYKFFEEVVKKYEKTFNKRD